MQIKTAEFIVSNQEVFKCPNNQIPEYAFIGRSNVGKSSLINMLTNQKSLAKTSGRPGKTQLINHFLINKEWFLVDLPGYGYAAVPGRVKQGWQKMIEGYLLDREELVNVYVLVDGEIGPTKLDVQMLVWLRANGVPHTVVATKHDKVKSSKRATRKKDLAAGCMLDQGDIVWVSASKGVGIEHLRSLVNSHLKA